MGQLRSSEGATRGLRAAEGATRGLLAAGICSGADSAQPRANGVSAGTLPSQPAA
eukprot:gene15433-7216_t